jgi:sterol 3beta-glucosyltransferase
MKIALISFGSRGDLEPLVALGAEMIKRGHSAYIIANSEIESTAAEFSVPVKSISFSVKELLHQKGEELLSSKSATKSLKILSSLIFENLPFIAKQVFEKANDADVILINERYYILAQSLKDKLNCKIVQICFQPKGVTNAYSYLYFRPWFFKLMSNRQTHFFVDKMLLKKFLPPINELRKNDFSLPPLMLQEVLQQKQEGLLLQGFSRALFARPNDWTNNFVVCGSWRLKKNKSDLSQELKLFLNTTKYKVYVGFGSMMYEPKKLLAGLQTLAEKMNIQIVLVQNWSVDANIQLGKLNNNVFILDSCEHDDLFPFVDLVIHHGGSGTINAAIRNAKPQIVAWFMLDQQFWASRVEALGVGVNAGTFHQLNMQKLEQAILHLQNNKTIISAVEKLSEKINEEDGAVTAVDYLEEYTT